ncbi:MAG: hypothetical protein V1900_00420 [Candidatus Aenigmatarchaeota archaeon]
MEVLVVKSKVKDYASKKKMRMGGDAIDELNKEVARLLDRAVERAKSDKKGTIKSRHV